MSKADYMIFCAIPSDATNGDMHLGVRVAYHRIGVPEVNIAMATVTEMASPRSIDRGVTIPFSRFETFVRDLRDVNDSEGEAFTALEHCEGAVGLTRSDGHGVYAAALRCCCSNWSGLM